ncbi:MAG: efflux transporter outer membrane subunit [Desulfobacteraceae bacterium]|jgi:NodT family efflux transporter outer membrane factor (OMF) lipoprotein
MKVTFQPLGLVLLAVLGLSGCMMLGPDYREPAAPVQPDWIEVEEALIETMPPVTAMWWQTAFRDPIIDQLVATALAQNLSLRAAGLRVLQARQQLLIAIGNQYPQQQQLGGQAGVEGLFSSSSEELYDLGFNLSWEADVWGRFRRQIESASAALDASLAGYDGIMVSLISEVAQTYLLIRTTQKRLAVARDNLRYQAEGVWITTAKYEAGEVSALDVEQAQSLFYNTQASVAVFEQSLQQFKNALAILLGQPPYDMNDVLLKPRSIPTVAPEVAIGMPQDLIRRRPDIRQAERQLASQSAQIGFAITDLYPQFGISGSVGTSVSTAAGFQFSDLFNSDTSGYNLFGVFQWNIFNYGRLKNNVRLQDAVFQQLLEDYRQTVLQAQGEVENAIVAFLKSQQQLASLWLAAEAAQRAVDISTEQYQDGLVEFNTVISTLRSLTAQQDQFASAKGTVAANLIEI